MIWEKSYPLTSHGILVIQYWALEKMEYLACCEPVPPKKHSLNTRQDRAHDLPYTSRVL